MGLLVINKSFFFAFFLKMWYNTTHQKKGKIFMDNLEKKFVSHSEYEQIYEKMKEYTEKYTRDNIDGNRYNLFLANGDYISIKIGENQIAHLLGLNVDLLRRENIVKSSLSSYQILNYFLDNITYYTLKK